MVLLGKSFGFFDEYQYGMLVFVSHAIILTIIFLACLCGVWFLDIELLYKVIISIILLPTMYDTFRHSVYTRFALWKQSLGHSIDDEELKKV